MDGVGLCCGGQPIAEQVLSDYGLTPENVLKDMKSRFLLANQVIGKQEPENAEDNIEILIASPSPDTGSP